MIRLTVSLVSLFTLSGCFVLQDAYDQQAVDQCREYPDTLDRIACEQQAKADASARRAENRNKE